jgi:hypothetical protein
MTRIAPGGGRGTAEPAVFRARDEFLAVVADVAALPQTGEAGSPEEGFAGQDAPVRRPGHPSSPPSRALVGVRMVHAHPFR